MVPVMSLNYEPQTVSPQTFDLLFEAERMNEHPTIDALEHRMGEAVDRDRLEAAARVLACPVKRIGPNWQHRWPEPVQPAGHRHSEGVLGAESAMGRGWLAIGGHGAVGGRDAPGRPCAPEHDRGVRAIADAGRNP
jgi:hypothetical protein